jgi:peroxiredoxin
VKNKFKKFLTTEAPALLALIFTPWDCVFPMKKELQSGDQAPDFTITAVGGIYGNGAPVGLSSLRGHPVVLYFYPKDDTPGCTTQACGVRDQYSAFVAKGSATIRL